MPADSTLLNDIGFGQLSDGVFLYSRFEEKSLIEKTKRTYSSPDVIIICAWGFAQVRHVTKYIAGHQSLYPTAKILLIYNSVANMVWKSDTSQMQWFQPAAAVLRECMDLSPDIRVLLHLFSNTGSHSAVQLAEACRNYDPPFTLPITSIILDSCPSMPILKPMANALALGLPSKNILIASMVRAMAYGIMGLSVVLERTGLTTQVATKLYIRLNSTNDGFLKRRVTTAEQIAAYPIPRTYIYGPKDDMIPVDQVVQHANIAIANMSACGIEHASSYVTLEEFAESPHVNHVKFEKERYWRVVKRHGNEALQVLRRNSPLMVSGLNNDRYAVDASYHLLHSIRYHLKMTPPIESKEGVIT